MKAKRTLRASRATPFFQFQTARGKAMLPTLMPVLGALDFPKDGEECTIRVTDNEGGVSVSVRRRKLVLANPRWAVTSGVDEEGKEVHTYRTLFEFEKENETDIIWSIQTLVTLSE